MEVGVEVSGVACGSFNQAGTYFWQAVYSGDSNNQGSSSLCTSETVAVGPVPTTLATTLSSSSILVGASVHDRSEEHTPELQSRLKLAYPLFLKNTYTTPATTPTNCHP